MIIVRNMLHHKLVEHARLIYLQLFGYQEYNNKPFLCELCVVKKQLNSPNLFFNALFVESNPNDQFMRSGTVITQIGCCKIICITKL